MIGRRAFTRVALAAAGAPFVACARTNERPVAAPAAAPAGHSGGPVGLTAPGSPNGALEVGGCRFRFVVDDEVRASVPTKYRTWVADAAGMVSRYYGRFPVPKLDVQLRTRGGASVGFGQHQDGRWVRVRVGSRVTPEKLASDWVMVHEMLHAAFPDLARRHGWMQEGQATYLEPIVRAQAGRKTAEAVWAKWARMMPHGRPGVGDRGLDNTRTWGRLYWGGALFWMYVDVHARVATDNRRGLVDALRAVLEAGGDGRADWDTSKVLWIGDEALGAPVLSEAYAKLARAPGDVDLDALFERLGVVVHDEDTVSFDDSAPWAQIRRAMI